MDRRRWLWRRKSSPSGETESSGSLSSHSERFSDDQALSNHNVHSPEVTSKAVQGAELDDTVKTLSEKLSESLLNIRAKEDLVKQHAKVAEEAVSGWERAENDVLALKKQNDALNQKNSSLNERVDHLDGALKECLRQLRQSRDEQEDKIHDAIAKKSREWESNKSQLENQLVELQTRIELSKIDSNNADICLKLEALEIENSILKLKLISKAKELELLTNERDLNTRAAENASKQHLDNVKMVAKLEAGCRRLKSTANKATVVTNESLTDSQSENGESIDSELCRTRGKRLSGPSVEIELMDDFLEMERLAAIPETHISSRENHLQDELEAMANRTRELEEDLRKMTAEKVSIELALNECQIQLNVSQDQLNQTMEKLVDMKMLLAVADEAKRDVVREAEYTKVKLKKLTKLLDEAELTIVRIRDELTKGNEAKRGVEMELEDANIKKAEAESRVKVMGHDLETLRASIFTLEKEVEKEKSFSSEVVAKCDILEGEISRMESKNSQFQRSAIVEEFRINQDKELAVAANKFAECQKTIASLNRQLKSLAAFEDFMIDTEKPEHDRIY